MSNLKKLILALLITSYGHTKSQNLYRSSRDSKIVVSGTSTLHDWSLTSKEVKIQAEINVNAEGALAGINSLTLSVRSESLKSGHSAMDKNTYSVLDTDIHKNITFVLNSSTVNQQKITGKGNLTIAGSSQPVTLETTCKILPDRIVHCTGAKDVKMSDFGIDPPSFMFGTVKTGDQVKVSFDVKLTPEK